MNISKFDKAEMSRRLKFRCRHGHNGFAHPKCYEEDNGIEEVIGFLDIETSGLDADFALVYTYCIKELNGPLIKRQIDPNDMEKGLLDKKLLEQFIKDAEKFDRFVVHYGSDYKFDIPFLRTRAVHWNLSFPEYKCIFVDDTYTILKSKFKLGSNRLGRACSTFGIRSKGHPLNQRIWMKMMSGNKTLRREALNYILTHNIEDVLATEALWKKIHGYVSKRKTSI